MSDRSAKFHETCILFENSTDVGDVEFIKVICKNDKKQEILDYHSFVPLKPEVEQRCSKGDETANERVSVLILGIDAVSRLNFYRTMPRTVKALEELGKYIKMCCTNATIIFNFFRWYRNVGIQQSWR